MKRLLALAAAGLLAATPAKAAEDLTVLLEWFVNPDHAPLVVAQQKGYFADAGLNVELIAPADPNDPPKLVAAGQAEVAIFYQPQLHMLAEQGLPLTRFGTLIGTPLNSVVALRGKGIETLADLEGKTIGYSVSGYEDALLGAMLEDVGLSLDDVELVNVNFALSPSLLSGQVDAVVGAFRNFELNQLEIEGHKGIAFYPEEHGVPPYEELVLLTSTDLKDDPRIKGFLDAVERGTLYLMNHPAESWALFIAAYPDLDDELNRRAWADTLRRFALRPAALDAGLYDEMAAFLKDRGMIQSIPALETYAVELR